ncbi:RAQPRD family integrative conjugative element protein [Pseudomonas sp.]|uniref:integrative conjugative element protein, RAQPRD family n=1 Tax=Pseudomonas sp. TaxID=306 RepID=UPI00262DCB4B|nr:RAQPRD family integrative conjugative element protein [Pseudomonas sp.]
MHTPQSGSWHAVFCAMVLLLAPPLAKSSDTTQEPACLADLIRQLDLIERLAEDSARLPRDDTLRYHFDYNRFRDDVQRMRQGIRDHLSPQRAQPRDPLPLSAEYRREADHEPE